MNDVESLHASVSHLYVFLEKCLFESFSHCFIGLSFFSGIELYELLVYLGN